MKRQYKITLIIILALIIFIGGYFLLRSFLTSDIQPTDTGTSTTEGTFPDIGDSEGDTTTSTDTGSDDGEFDVPTLISDEGNNVFDFWMDEATGDAVYITMEGQIYNAKVGQDIEISNQTISAINWVKISPSGEYVLVAFGNPKGPNWGIFDNEDNVWRPLPSTIVNAVWLNNDDLILITESQSGRSLERVSLDNGALSDFDLGSNIIINNFRIRDLDLYTTPNNRLIVLEKPSSHYEGRLWELDINDGSIHNLIDGERGMMTKWTENYVFKFSSPNNFFILNHDLQNIIPTFFKTLPSKCIEGDNVIYCGAPIDETLGERYVLPDDYLQKRVFTTDELYEIDTSTFNIEKVFQSGVEDIPALDIKNPRLFNGDLYFINRYNDGLYRVSF